MYYLTAGHINNMSCYERDINHVLKQYFLVEQGQLCSAESLVCATEGLQPGITIMGNITS